jgi:hypothetical protein
MTKIDWSPEATFTKHHAEWMMEQGAGTDVLQYVGATVDAYAAADPWDALQFAAAHLTPARLDACAVAEPSTALIFAASMMTADRLDECAFFDPDIALEYACDFLSAKTRAKLEQMQ